MDSATPSYLSENITHDFKTSSLGYFSWHLNPLAVLVIELHDLSRNLVGKSWSFVNSIFFQNARLLIVTQEKAKLDAKMKQTDSRMVDGMSEEMTEYEFKKMEKEKQVTELRERLAKIKEKVCLKMLR